MCLEMMIKMSKRNKRTISMLSQNTHIVYDLSNPSNKKIELSNLFWPNLFEFCDTLACCELPTNLI